VARMALNDVSRMARMALNDVSSLLDPVFISGSGIKERVQISKLLSPL